MRCDTRLDGVDEPVPAQHGRLGHGAADVEQVRQPRRRVLDVRADLRVTAPLSSEVQHEPYCIGSTEGSSLTAAPSPLQWFPWLLLVAALRNPGP